MSTVKLAIVFYSTYGTNHQMAEIAAEAARAAGATEAMAWSNQLADITGLRG